MTDYKFCIWREDEDGNWKTKCGCLVIVHLGTPRDNGFKFCQFCGRKLKQKVFKEKL